MSFRCQFAHPFVWPATFLLLIVTFQTSAQDLRPEEKAELWLLSAIATSVRDTIRGSSAINSLSDQGLQSFVTKSLNTAHTQLSSEAEWGTPGSQAALNQIRASNDAAGSFEGDIHVWPVNRVVLNLKLPIHGERGFGMFVEFHGEWEHSLGFLRDDSERKVFVESVGNFQNIRPPTYQFRLGALLDPAELFSPLFGS